MLFIVLLTTSGCYFFTSRPEPKITWKINRDGKWENLVNGKDNFEIADAFHGRLLNIISVKKKRSMRPHTAVKQKILKMLEIRKYMIYNLEWKVNGLRAFPFTPSNDRIIARQSWILDSRYWIRNSLSEKLGFWIPIFSEIQVSLS